MIKLPHRKDYKLGSLLLHLVNGCLKKLEITSILEKPLERPWVAFKPFNTKWLRSKQKLLFAGPSLISALIYTKEANWITHRLPWLNIMPLIYKTKLQLIVYNYMEGGAT